MANDAFSRSAWAPALKDSALILSSFISILFSLLLMGVPILSRGLGLGVDPSWQTISISVLALVAGGYVLIEVLADVFTKNQKILQTPAGSRWKPLTSSLVLLLVIFGLMYSKALRGSSA
jgi:hypothetical protein